MNLFIQLTFIPLIDGSISSGFPLSSTFLCMVCELKDSFSLLVDSAAASSCDFETISLICDEFLEKYLR
jgi:hypothetical protein